MEPGTKVEMHYHPVGEMFIVIRGAIKAILVDDDFDIFITSAEYYKFREAVHKENNEKLYIPEWYLRYYRRKHNKKS